MGEEVDYIMGIHKIGEVVGQRGGVEKYIGLSDDVILLELIEG